MEFLDLEIFLKLFLAFVVGIVIGIEREFAGKEAGPRTYALVALGSVLFTVVSLSPIFENDNARIISQIIPGIGFIGAGLIIFHQSRVHGLATAAAIWVTAAISIAIGVGLYSLALFAVILSIMVLYVFRKFDVEDRIHKMVGMESDDDDDDKSNRRNG